MKPSRVFLWLSLLCVPALRSQAVFGQSTAPQNTAAVQNAGKLPAAGLENPWDVRDIAAALIKDSDDWKPVLEHLNPQQWHDAKGAPSTYLLVLQTLQRQLNDVAIITRQLTSKTDSLSLCLDDYFRLEAFDVTARSLLDGVQKYGERQSAEKMNALLARNFNHRERFRDYIRDLAVSTEQNFKIADAEAQRCRGMISKEAPTSSRKRR